MGSVVSREQAVATAIENQDAGELRTILRDMTPDQIRVLCVSYAPENENQCTILHFATWQDNPEILAPLLDYADDLEVRDALGWTPLMTAVNRGSKQNVNLLLARGAKIDCDWTKGMSLIADAMNFNDIELITTLLNNGAQVTPTTDMLANGQDQSAFYLLHYAVDDGLLDVAKLLIERGKAPLNVLDQSGWSPLHLAAGHNNIDLLTLLIEKGADVNIKDSKDNTPLAWAREMNASDAMRELTKCNAVADKEWHGEKLEMKTSEQREEEAWEAGELAQDADGKETGVVKNGRFEIEIDDSKSKQPNSPNSSDTTAFDTLQRQRSAPKAVV